MLVPSIIAVVFITLFVVFVRLRKHRVFSDKDSWKLVDSISEEWPKRPTNLSTQKNPEGVYLDRVPRIADTEIYEHNRIFSFSKIAGDQIKSLPLYTTDHSNEEHFLTTIHISFHVEEGQAFMDILSLDKDFPLKNNNQFSLLFTNGEQWDFSFNKQNNDEYASSIPLQWQQLQYLAKNSLDKWRLRRDKDDYFTVGALNFEIKKYVYKPELQATVKLMAEKILALKYLN